MKAAGDKLASLLSGDQDNFIFLHNTKNRESAESIMRNGFNFESQLAYSTDRVNPRDTVEISYFLVERKDYGHHTIIIEINKALFLRYTRLAESTNLHFEDILTVTIPVISENDEYIYTLSHHYIKGIYNIKTGEMTHNADFDPMFESPMYLQNFNRLKQDF